MSLRRDALLNLAGSVLPMAVAMPAVGYLARVLSVEAFSLVGLAWALVGYAGVLDMGLSRAVVKSIAENKTDIQCHARVLTTGVFAVFCIGLLLASGLIFSSGQLLDNLLKVAPVFRQDAVTGIFMVALSIPLLLPSSIVQGYWDGLEDFKESNWQRTIGGTSVPLLTVVGVHYEGTFSGAMTGLLLSRVFVLALAVWRGRVWLKLHPRGFSLHELRLLWNFGGWVMVSNIISPLMGYMDRYVLGYAQSAAVVGYYAAPCDAALRLLIIPVAVTRSLFPKLVDSAAVCEGVRASARLRLLTETFLIISALCIPLAAILAWYADYVLNLWLGEIIGRAAIVPFRILMLGFVLFSFGQVPFVLLQANGRADWTARIHLLEVVPFMIMTYYLSLYQGAAGAALAWTLRGGADLLLLCWAAVKCESDEILAA